jgi:phage gp37-like protein
MIAAIELAVLDRLRTMGAAIGVTWRFLDTLPEDWESYLVRKKAEIKGPAAWIAFTGWGKAEQVGDQLLVDGSFALLVANQSFRPDEAANRHGGPDPLKEPGSYRLALGAAALLAGHMLDLDLVTPIEVGAAELLPRSKAMMDLQLSVTLLDLSCRFPIQLSGDGDLAALEALHVNWDMPALNLPFAIDRDPVAEGVQLPDDANADATDHIILQEPST